jgi:hypothetical protein
LHRSHSCLAIMCCTVPIAMVALFQLRPEKKDTVVCPLLPYSNYDRKKKIQLSGNHSLRRSNCNYCAAPITTQKKSYSPLSVVMPFQLRQEKKIQLSGHQSLCCSNCHGCAVPIMTRNKKIQSSDRCYAIPIMTEK